MYYFITTMGQILHQRARTTQGIRKEIQEAKGSLKALAKRFGVNIKTIAKWKKRESVEDAKMGNGRANTVLTEEEEVVICEMRRKTWLPLDDLLDHLKPVIPKLSRSNLHRCLRHYGISTVPKEFSPYEEVKEKGKFKSYEIGFLHVDITEFYLCEKKYYLFVAIDRVTKMIFAHLYEQKRVEDTLDFMEKVFQFFPYKIHRVLTDNGLQFSYRAMPQNKRPRDKKGIPLRHPFSALLQKNGIKHKLTAFYSPQTNGQVEKANDILKKATIKLFHYDTVQQFQLNLQDFLNYYNCSKKLSALKRKSPYEFILQKYHSSPNLFSKNPFHHCVGLNTYACKKMRTHYLYSLNNVKFFF